MSRKLFAFLLSELSIVRVICKHDKCGVVTEMPFDHLGRLNHAGVECPHCKGHWTSQVGAGGVMFGQLQFAIEEAQRTDAKFDIEFVLPGE